MQCPASYSLSDLNGSRHTVPKFEHVRACVQLDEHKSIRIADASPGLSLLNISRSSDEGGEMKTKTEKERERDRAK